MSSEQQLLNNNLSKWQTLPAGEGRQHIHELLQMTDEELREIYDQFIPFWKEERGWEYERYSPFFSNKNVLEIGSGLGYDGLTFAKVAKSWSFCDIIKDNLLLVERLSRLHNRENVTFHHLSDIANHQFPQMYDGFYAHGVLHHVPFPTAQKEIANINKYLYPGALIVILMYPYERWEMCGKPDFKLFGTMTDGEGTPWAEYYDEEKIMQLFGPEYTMLKTIKWGEKNAEFVNFELQKTKGLTR